MQNTINKLINNIQQLIFNNMKQNIVTYQEKTQSVLERINQKETIYLCVDCENMPCFGSASYGQALAYARINYCTISEYPKGTFTEQRTEIY